jgi:hypothetical protein
MRGGGSYFAVSPSSPIPGGGIASPDRYDYLGDKTAVAVTAPRQPAPARHPYEHDYAHYPQHHHHQHQQPQPHQAPPQHDVQPVALLRPRSLCGLRRRRARRRVGVPHARR